MDEFSNVNKLIIIVLQQRCDNIVFSKHMFRLNKDDKIVWQDKNSIF